MIKIKKIAFNIVAQVRGPIPMLRNDGNVSTVKQQQSQRRNVLKWETAWLLQVPMARVRKLNLL